MARRYLLPLDSSAKRLIAIDPGLGGTGWATWDVRHRPWGEPTDTGVVRDTAKDETLAVRCQELCDKLIASIDLYSSLSGRVLHPQTFVYLEMPQHMGGRKGIAAQAGSVYTLTFLVGYMAARLHPCPVIVTNPGEWKGQLPKDVVQRRVERILGRDVCHRLEIKTHAWDAVGIGLWALGRM